MKISVAVLTAIKYIIFIQIKEAALFFKTLSFFASSRGYLNFMP
jgi:hypothetical protein